MRPLEVKRKKKSGLWKYLKTKEGKLKFKEWSHKKAESNMESWRARMEEPVRKEVTHVLQVDYSCSKKQAEP